MHATSFSKTRITTCPKWLEMKCPRLSNRPQTLIRTCYFDRLSVSSLTLHYNEIDSLLHLLVTCNHFNALTVKKQPYESYGKKKKINR